MLVKERQDDLWRQAEQARQRREARHGIRHSRAHLFQAIGDYLTGWRQTPRRQECPGARLETYEPTPRIRHAVS
jgi:hypothetical protein